MGGFGHIRNTWNALARDEATANEAEEVAKRCDGLRATCALRPAGPQSPLALAVAHGDGVVAGSSQFRAAPWHDYCGGGRLMGASHFFESSPLGTESV